jgi:glycine C-acetyltransferase
MKETGFNVGDSIHPIVPIILGDAQIVQEMSQKMLDKGVYVVGFFYPVVPKGKARIRVQISAAHTKGDLDFAIEAFCKTREEMA